MIYIVECRFSSGDASWWERIPPLHPTMFTRTHECQQWNASKPPARFRLIIPPLAQTRGMTYQTSITFNQNRQNHFCRHWWEHREQIDKTYKLCTYSLVHSCIWVQLSRGKSGIPLATNGNSTKKMVSVYKVNQHILGYNGKGHTHIYIVYVL